MIQKQRSRRIRRVSGLVIIIFTIDMLVERQPRPTACGCEVGPNDTVGKVQSEVCGAKNI